MDKHSSSVIIYRNNPDYMCYSENQKASKFQEYLYTEIVLAI